jgi:hypothetical protein
MITQLGRKENLKLCHILICTAGATKPLDFLDMGGRITNSIYIP